MDLRSQYVPLAWYNTGYVGSTHESLGRSLPTTTSPPPPYTERDPRIDLKDIHRALRYRPSEKQIIYATIRPSLPRLRIALEQSPPTSPHSIIPSRDGYPPSLMSNTSSISSDSSLSQGSTSSGCSPRALRRSGRRARGISLRELRQKQSEADLQRAYTSSVDEYLNGDIFDNFRVGPEAAIVEDA